MCMRKMFSAYSKPAFYNCSNIGFEMSFKHTLPEFWLIGSTFPNQRSRDVHVCHISRCFKCSANLSGTSYKPQAACIKETFETAVVVDKQTSLADAC